jgi:hypothetical protein
MPTVGTQEVADELAELDARCRAHHGVPLDLAAELRRLTQARRVRFVHGGSRGEQPLGVDLVDAVVHAAEHGYRLCLHVDAGESCWLPAGHDDDHAYGWLRWALLYGQGAGGVMVVCARCTPNRWVPAPDDCPHRPAQRTSPALGG